MLVFVKRFIVHTLCHYCKMVATAAGMQQGLKVFGGGLEELQVKDEGEIQYLGTNKYISVGFLHLQLIHILALSPQVTVVHGYLLSTYRCGIRILSAMVWSQGGADYTASPISEPWQLLELWYGGLQALLYLLLTRVI